MKLTGSWRTSALGIASILAAISGVITVLLDGDPTTNPNWTLTGSAIATGWAAIMARDNRVSSEAAGLHPKPSDAPPK